MKLAKTKVNPINIMGCISCIKLCSLNAFEDRNILSLIFHIQTACTLTTLPHLSYDSLFIFFFLFLSLFLSISLIWHPHPEKCNGHRHGTMANEYLSYHFTHLRMFNSRFMQTLSPKRCDAIQCNGMEFVPFEWFPILLHCNIPSIAKP